MLYDMLCYVMLYNMCYVLLYNICYMTCYVMLCNSQATKRSLDFCTT